MNKELENTPVCNLTAYDFQKMMRSTISSGVATGMIAASLFMGMIAVVLMLLF